MSDIEQYHLKVRAPKKWATITPEEQAAYEVGWLDATSQAMRGTTTRRVVGGLRESAETLHRVSSWWEHTERSFEDCPAESCVKARAALGGQS
jgi:hypothetical protein